MSDQPLARLSAETTERCAECGRALALRDALVYHGLVYHPECASGVRRPAPFGPAASLRTERWPFGTPEFNCTGDL